MDNNQRTAAIKAYPSQAKSEITAIAGLNKGWIGLEKFLDAKAKPNTNALANELNKID